MDKQRAFTVGRRYDELVRARSKDDRPYWNRPSITPTAGHTRDSWGRQEHERYVSEEISSSDRPKPKDMISFAGPVAAPATHLIDRRHCALSTEHRVHLRRTLTPVHRRRLPPWLLRRLWAAPSRCQKRSSCQNQNLRLTP